MIDFKNPKNREKSPLEKEYDEVCAEYEKAFGKPYVIHFGLDEMTTDEVIADVRRRIKENDPQRAPDYEPGNLY